MITLSFFFGVLVGFGVRWALEPIVVRRINRARHDHKSPSAKRKATRQEQKRKAMTRALLGNAPDDVLAQYRKQGVI